MMRIKSKAFTLIEILIAVTITGLIASLAISPVVFAVNRIVDLQIQYSDDLALQRTLNFIEKDILQVVRTAPVQIVIANKENLDSRNDSTLVIFSSSLAAQNLPTASIVYKLQEKKFNSIQGLYRWFFPAVFPDKVNIETLNIDNAQLILPDVSDFLVEAVFTSDSNQKNHKGALPPGVYLKLSRNINDNKNEIEKFLPIL